MSRKENIDKKKRDGVGMGLSWVYVLLLGVAVIFFGKLVWFRFCFKMDPRIESVVKAKPSKEYIEPDRGTILSEDGRLLATSIPNYSIYMDCTVRKEEFRQKGERGAKAEAEWMDSARALCAELPGYFPQKNKDEYFRMIKEARTNAKYPNRKHRLIGTDVDYGTLQQIKALPLFNQGQNKGGIIIEEKIDRQYPYGSLGRSVIGYTRDESYKGLEGRFDNILRGQKGWRWIRLTDRKMKVHDYDSTKVDSRNGLDLRTSINIDLQDLTDRALRETIGTDSLIIGGTAIVMEVKTGAVRAMVNLKRDSDGRLGEVYNYAVAHADNPGSVFKLATLMNLLEDKHVKSLESTIPTNHGRMANYPTDTHITDFERETKRSSISILEGLEMSSNYVFRYLAQTYYKDNPKQFYDHLYRCRFGESYADFDLNGMASGKLRTPEQTGWTLTDLGSTAIGYAMSETPLHIITFYNAIANGGKMMMPYLVESFETEGRVVEKRGPKVLNARICSKATADTLRRGLVSVTEHGTGSRLKGAMSQVAGKTGTARGTLTREDSATHAGRDTDASGKRKYTGSYVGFFPADDPKYTMLVTVYSDLTRSVYYGGNKPAVTVRKVVDGLCSMDKYWQQELKRSGSTPLMRSKAQETELEKVLETGAGTVPELKDLGLKEAIYAIENAGFTCSFSGVGRVKSQSIKAGSKAKEGTTISIELR